MDGFGKRLGEILSSEQIIFNAPMKEHTTFKIGGAADVLIFPSNAEQVAQIFRLANEFKIPCTILGNGSNVLVLDNGIRGAVVKFSDKFLGGISVDGTKITAGAGAKLKDVANFAAENNLSGMEFACGIPGSIGGAVFMTAGAYDGEMKNVVAKVTAVSSGGELKVFGADELNLGYRQSIFQTNGYAICEVELKLIRGDGAEIKNKMADFTQKRESKQPLELPSAGSTFKRPVGGYAAALIEQSGLKGYKVGGAEVSEKHSGFVINTGGATCEDVLAVMRHVREKVFADSGIMLEPEVRLINCSL